MHPETLKLEKNLDVATYEYHIWLLLQELLLCEESNMNHFKLSDYDTRFSHENITKQIFSEYPLLKRCLAILNWLEYTSSVNKSNDLQSYNENIINLRSKRLKNQEMDPDSILRSLHNIDASSNTTLYHQYKQQEDVLIGFLAHIYRLIRSGEINDAIELCRNSNQPWRASTLTGGEYWSQTLHKSARDKQNSTINSSNIAEITGNPRYFLWKKLCIEYSNNTNLSAIERAIYASLCGNIKQVLPQCKIWEDFLWIFLNHK